LEGAIDENVKMVFIESPMNPSMTVLDIRAIAEIVHTKSKAFLVVDNTFLTPYFQRPLELNADIALYSMSKFIGGHSDLIGGMITTNDDKIFETIKHYQIAIGVVPSPFDSYLINRSLKTLHLRMERHFENSYAVAKFLESHDKIEKVNHPSLKSHPGYKIAVSQSYGHSGVFSFVIRNGSLENSITFFNALKLIAVGESLGGTESLASFPWMMTHAWMSEEERIKAGVTNSLIRISIGVEDIYDLIDDIKQALKEI
jgi:cystathionine gamma-lyase